MSDTVFCVRIYLVCVVYAVSDAYCKVLCRVMGGYSHLVPAGTFRVSFLIGFVCPCIMLCLWRVLHRLAARRYLSCRGARPRNVT